jgi:hypothetical protein
MRWHRRWFGGGILAAALVSMAPNAWASEYFDGQRGEIAARISSQNSFHHDNADSVQWVQWRNEIRFDLKYDLIESGSGQSWGPITKAKFNMLYRARMDPVFLLRDSYERRNFDRDNFIFPEGKIPRELFLDVGFGGALENLSFRIGRQQVVWGESDLFRSLDVVNPLNISQNGLVGEDFADYREPLWIAKALYNVGPITEAFNDINVEAFYSPNAAVQVDRPWVLYGQTFKSGASQNTSDTNFAQNITLPLRQVAFPWELGRVGARYGDSPGVVQTQTGSFSDFVYQIHNNDMPSSDLDVHHKSMFGIRILGTTFGNTFFTLNYLFKRTDTGTAGVAYQDIYDTSLPGTGALKPEVLNEALAALTSPDLNGNGVPDGQEIQQRNCITGSGKPEVVLRSLYSDPKNPALATGVNNISDRAPLPLIDDGNSHATGCLGIPIYHPWTHIIGFTATYNDANYTGLVFRLEQSWSTKEGRTSVAANHPARLKKGDGNPNQNDFDTHNYHTTGVWRSMIGFDYLRAIAPQSGRTIPIPLIRSLLTDTWFYTFQFLNEYDSHYNNVLNQTSFTNRVPQFNPVLTYAMSGFFLHQTVRPTIAAGLDINTMYPLFLIQSDYFLTEKLVVRLGEIIYAGSKNAEDQLGLHFYSGRDEFFVRLTYFLA